MIFNIWKFYAKLSEVLQDFVKCKFGQILKLRQFSCSFFLVEDENIFF